MMRDGRTHAVGICGVDVGGTFTDFVLLYGNRIETLKLPTTPADPSQAILNGVGRLAKHLGEDIVVAQIIHGTTLPANAVIERRGARTALVTTEGFRDLLDFRRESRYDIFDLNIKFPLPLVPIELRWAVRGRVQDDGEEIVPLDTTGVKRCGEALAATGVQSVAICFLHSYANPEHEESAYHILRQIRPDLSITLSSEVAPLVREYERSSTTVINAYVRPVVDRYLKGLDAALTRTWPDLQLRLMVSNGGVSSVAHARRFPVRLIESGPAAGVFAGVEVSRRLRLANLLVFDMGGTTAKLCAVQNSEPSMTSTLEVARTSRFQKGSGMPLLTRAIDLLEVGAGGGSIASVDSLGLLTVGPRSAGADPGPACYDRGGVEPTVTDADLMLGYLDESRFLGGAMRLSHSRAQTAIESLSRQLGLGVLETCWGIHDLVNENMAAAVRLYMAEKGFDPRLFVLSALGGAGPVHACHLAEKVGISHVVCPLKAGVASAFGLLLAPPRVDISRAFRSRLIPSCLRQLEAEFGRLKSEARSELEQLVKNPMAIRIHCELDMRYYGQRSEVEVPIDPHLLTNDDLVGIRSRFESRYAEVYGRALTNALDVEIMAIRLTAIGPRRAMDWQSAGQHAKVVTPPSSRNMFLANREMCTAAVFSRDQLGPDGRQSGPALIEEIESTAVVPYGWEYWIDDFDALQIKVRKSD